MANEDLETRRDASRRDASNDDRDECPELTIAQVDELFADDFDAWSSEAWRGLLIPRS